MSSLEKLKETRSNVPRVTLLHYMVTEAQQQNERVIEFAHELSQTLQRTHRFKLNPLFCDAVLYLVQ